MKQLYLLLFFSFSLLLCAEKVEITSDTMKAEELNREVRFIGNVTIKQHSNWIHSNQVIVYFDDQNKTNRYEAIGAVTFEFKQQNRFYKGKADKVIYDPIHSVYRLRGNASLDDIVNKRHLKGNHITLDLTSGLAEVQGDKKKPVKFIFESGKNKQ
ncbi:MAG: lipopolysaccharide transport periplasmic protein LptA [Sulfurimonas sp.]